MPRKLASFDQIVAMSTIAIGLILTLLGITSIVPDTHSLHALGTTIVCIGGIQVCTNQILITLHNLQNAFVHVMMYAIAVVGLAYVIQSELQPLTWPQRILLVFLALTVLLTVNWIALLVVRRNRSAKPYTESTLK